MRFVLPEEYFCLFEKIDLSEVASFRCSIERQLVIEIEDCDYQDFMIAINDAIVLKGMDDNDTVNELGKSLYKLYDTVLAQLK